MTTVSAERRKPASGHGGHARQRRLVGNSLVSLVRVFGSALLALATVPLLLHNLGVDDFGLYTVVAGFVGMLSFLNGALAVGAQRHFSYAAGSAGPGRVRHMFGNCMAVHLGIAVALVLVGEALGYWYVTQGLNAPADRSGSALLVLHTSMACAAVGLLTVPFQALLLAKEALGVVAVLEIAQSLAVFALTVAIGFLPGDRLTFYAVGIALAMLAGSVATMLICRSRYIEADLRSGWSLDRSVMRELASFAGWNTVGSLARVARIHGIGLVLNFFFGTVANAAYGVAIRLGNFHSAVTMSFRKASAAQVVETEATGERGRSLRLADLVGKHSFFFAAVWVIPLLAELEFVFSLWLRDYPPLAVGLTRIFLLTLTFELLTTGFITSLQAIGRIGLYQTVVGLILLIPVPVGFMAGRAGASPETMLWIAFVAAILASAARMQFLRRLAGFSYPEWLRCTLRQSLFGLLPAVAVAMAIRWLMPDGWLRLLVLTLASIAAWAAGVWWFGVDEDERNAVRVHVLQRLRMKFRRIMNPGISQS